MVSNPETPSFNTVEDEKRYHGYDDAAVEHDDGDPFGSEEFADVKYKTMGWWWVGKYALDAIPALGTLS